MTLFRLLLSLSLWITSVVSIVALCLNGWSWLIFILAISTWLLAYLCWPRDRPNTTRRTPRQPMLKNADLLNVDLWELIFTFIEWPIRGFFWLLRGVWHGLDGL